MTTFSVVGFLNPKNVTADFVKHPSQAWWNRRPTDAEWDAEVEKKRRKLIGTEEEIQAAESAHDGPSRINVVSAAPPGALTRPAPAQPLVRFSASLLCIHSSQSHPCSFLSKENSSSIRLDAASSFIPALALSESDALPTHSPPPFPTPSLENYATLLPQTQKAKHEKSPFRLRSFPLSSRRPNKMVWTSTMCPSSMRPSPSTRSLQTSTPFERIYERGCTCTSFEDSRTERISPSRTTLPSIRKRRPNTTIRTKSTGPILPALTLGKSTSVTRSASSFHLPGTESDRCSQAVKIPNPEENGFQIRYPFSRGGFNTTDYTSAQELVGDIERIWLGTLEQELGITKAELKVCPFAVFVRTSLTDYVGLLGDSHHSGPLRSSLYSRNGRTLARKYRFQADVHATSSSFLYHSSL